MRNGWRGAWVRVSAVVLLGTMVAAGPRPEQAPATIRLTVDVTWGDPALPILPSGSPASALAVKLQVGQGKILEARNLSPGAIAPQASPDGSWQLGTSPSGTARVRIETRANAEITASAGGTPTRFAVAALFETPLKTGPGSPIPMHFERVSWDAIEVKLGPEADFAGVAAPGEALPVSVGFNVLLPEPAEVTIRYSAEVRPARGGPPVWVLPTYSQVVATNTSSPAEARFQVPAPRVEGSYVLDVRATWEPVGATEGSRLARLLKWRRNSVPRPLERRVSFAVVDPRPGSTPAPAVGVEAVADSLDLSRPRPFRAMASGRNGTTGPTGSWVVPEAAMVEAGRRDRLRGWMARAGGEAATLGAADGTGLSWSAVPLQVAHPGRPHRLTVAVAEGEPSDLAVAVIAPGGSVRTPRLLLDAAASGPLVSADGAPHAFSWPIWPDSPEVVVVVVNRSERSPVRLASFELREMASDPLPANLAEVHADAPRPLALNLASPGALNRFGGTVEGGPDDAWSLANNLALYAQHCGASTVILPSDLADRARRTALGGHAQEDSTAPDRLDLILRMLARRGLSAMLEMRFDGPLPGLPPGDSPEALARGLVRVNREGQAAGVSYQPLHAEVREAMKRAASEAIRPRQDHPNLTGLIVRLGPGATLPGSPEVGLDDATFPRFIKASYQPDQVARVPGLDPSAEGRFADRFRFVTGTGRNDWLDWRAEQVGILYADLARGVTASAPGALLAVVTPGLDDGAAGEEARIADHAGLPPSQAWKSVGLDLKRWPVEAGGPIVLRGVGLSTDDLGHDLATSPDLDEAVAARPGRGLWLGPAIASASAPSTPTLTARPIAHGASGEEPLGHALAVLDARIVVISGQACAGQEERVQRFARVFRALPALPNDSAPPSPRLDSGVAVRSWVSRGKTFVELANDTPYAIYLESVLHDPNDSQVDDLGRRQKLIPAAAPGGGKSLVLELPPFGVAAIRVASPKAKVVPIGPYLPSARELDVQYERLSARLGKLAQDGPTSGPTNAGFEDPSRSLPVAEIRPQAPGPVATAPLGWSLEGDPSNFLVRDDANPRSGRAAMRLDARALPASAVSEPFVSPGRNALLLRAWIRAEEPETLVKVAIEGEAAGKPFRRDLEVSAGPEWAEFRLRADDLPQGGPDRLRLRFERTTVGLLWIDDVTVSGDGTPESARRAELILKAALHAYREKRYADFARLSSSHWARQLEPQSRQATPPERAGVPLRTGNATTDLPSGRRLR